PIREHAGGRRASGRARDRPRHAGGLRAGNLARGGARGARAAAFSDETREFLASLVRRSGWPSRLRAGARETRVTQPCCGFTFPARFEANQDPLPQTRGSCFRTTDVRRCEIPVGPGANSFEAALGWNLPAHPRCNRRKGSLRNRYLSRLSGATRFLPRWPRSTLPWGLAPMAISLLLISAPALATVLVDAAVVAGASPELQNASGTLRLAGPGGGGIGP